MQSGTYLALIARLESIAQELSIQPSGAEADAKEDEGAKHWEEAGSHLKIVADGLREESLRGQLARTSLPSLLTTYLRLSVQLPPLASSSTSRATYDSSATATAQISDPAGDDQNDTDDPVEELGSSIQDLAILEANAVGTHEWTKETREGMVVRLEAEEAVEQVGRVAANLAFDDDENRSILMTYQYPSSVFQVLATYLPTTLTADDARSSRATARLPTVRALVASLLNCVLGEFDVIKLFILQPPTFNVLLDLANSIYTPCALLPESTSPTSEGAADRALTAGWLWRILEECMATESAPKAITAAALPPLLLPLRCFSSPSPSATQTQGSNAIADNRKVDLQILTTACQTLEGLALDRPDLLSAFQARDSLRVIVDFVDRGSPPSQWFAVGHDARSASPASSSADIDEEEAQLSGKKPTSGPEEIAEKAVGLGKACMMKVLIEICGEDVVEANWFWETLRGWLKMGGKSTEGPEAGGVREDLVSCALLCFGNSARTEHSAAALLSSSPSTSSLGQKGSQALLPYLLPLLHPSTDPKIQHALVGLLKNLSIPAANKPILGDAGVIESLVGMRPLLPERDLLGSVQGGAVGILKHLAMSDVPNCHRILMSESLVEEESIPSQLLALISRSDDAAIKCEASRVFVNLIKTLYSSDVLLRANGAEVPADHGGKSKREDSTHKAVEAAALLESRRIVSALYGLLGLAGKYVVLVGEGVLALNLLCRTKSGLKIVASTTLANSHAGAAKSTPLSTLLELLYPRTESGSPPIPLEIKSNVYLLLITLRKAPGVEHMQGFEAGRVRVAKLVEVEVDGKEDLMRQALAEAWSGGGEAA